MVRFELFGIPVGVHFTFLFMAVLGLGVYEGVELVYWTLAAFVAILLHELGHALTARRFGASAISITLFALGGVTTHRPSSSVSHGQLFLVSAAGSAVGIVSGLVFVGLGRAGLFESVPRVIDVFIVSFVYVALVWGVLNWVPIVPLDGGHMVLHLAAIFNPDRAPLIAQVVTWIAVAIVVPLAVINDFLIAAFLVVMFAMTGLREYRRSTSSPPPAPVRPPDEQPEPTTEGPPPDESSDPPAFPI